MRMIGPGLGSSATRLAPIVTKSVPTNGQTVAAATGSISSTVFLAPATTLATLTVSLPADANSQLGDVVTIATSKTLTLLTINGAANIMNSVTVLAVNESASFQKVDTDTWVRLI